MAIVLDGASAQPLRGHFPISSRLRTSKKTEGAAPVVFGSSCSVLDFLTSAKGAIRKPSMTTPGVKAQFDNNKP
jgi:hypothetical protein